MALVGVVRVCYPKHPAVLGGKIDASNNAVGGDAARLGDGHVRPGRDDLAVSTDKRGADAVGWSGGRVLAGAGQRERQHRQQKPDRVWRCEDVCNIAVRLTTSVGPLDPENGLVNRGENVSVDMRLDARGKRVGPFHGVEIVPAGVVVHAVLASFFVIGPQVYGRDGAIELFAAFTDPCYGHA
jgi:hypothetical protein